MITLAGSNDPVSVTNDCLSGRLLDRCGQKPHRFFYDASCRPFGWDVYGDEALNYGLRGTRLMPPT